MKTTVSRVCPMCGKVSVREYDGVAIMSYQAGSMSVQQAFPSSHPSDREFLISGMCYDCCEKTFNQPAPGHEEDWGEQLGECACCGRPVYKKDLNEDEEFTCISCACDEYN